MSRKILDLAGKPTRYEDFIEQAMLKNGGFAPLKLLYEEKWNYIDKNSVDGLTPNMTIQERVQRLAKFTRIASGVYALTDFIKKIDENNNQFLIIKKDKIVVEKITEKFANQKIRMGQDNFRQSLLQELKSCPITGIDDTKLLIASHIKPWAFSNNLERMNSKNGFLLSPLFDKLFDKNIGLITFTIDKRVLISNKLSKTNQEKLGIQNSQIIQDLSVFGREEFLEYHNKYIFQN
jgi:putative restriction endonuclease